MSFIATGAVPIWAHDLLKCAIYEHHGYWFIEGKRCFNSHSASSEFLLSSEDTAFEIDVLAEFSNLLVIGAVPLSTYAASYNRRIQDCKVAIMDDLDPRVIRMKMYVGKFALKLFVMKVIPMRKLLSFLPF